MTSRERIKAALNHKEPDKIPIDCGAMHSSGISAITYNKLKEYLGIKTGSTKIYDLIQQLVVPEQWYLDKFSVDTVDLARIFTDKEDEWIDWILPDGSLGKVPAWVDMKKKGDRWVCHNEEGEEIASMGKGVFYFNQTIYPFYGQQIDNFDDLPRYMDKVSWFSIKDPLWRSFDEKNFLPSLGKAAKKLFEETDYSLVANYGGLYFEPGQWLYRNDNFFIKMILEPKEITSLFEKLTEIHMENLEPFLKQITPYADVLILSDDLGMQTGPLISPQMFKELIFPWYKMIFDFVKDKADIKIFLHSCGSFVDIIPYLIEAGLDILNPVQTQTAGMGAKKLKNEFGKDLVFWGGGIDTQHILSKENPQKVRDEVRRNCEIFMKDGGFVFNPIHNILPGVPPQNIVAMYEEANSIRY